MRLAGNHTNDFVAEDATIVLFLSFFRKNDDTVLKRKKSKVLPDSHVVTGKIFTSFLTHENVASGHDLTRVKLYAKALTLGISTVFGGTTCFFM